MVNLRYSSGKQEVFTKKKEDNPTPSSTPLFQLCPPRLTATPPPSSLSYLRPDLLQVFGPITPATIVGPYHTQVGGFLNLFRAVVGPPRCLLMQTFQGMAFLSMATTQPKDCRMSISECMCVYMGVKGL